MKTDTKNVSIVWPLLILGAFVATGSCYISMDQKQSENAAFLIEQGKVHNDIQSELTSCYNSDSTGTDWPANQSWYEHCKISVSGHHQNVKIYWNLYH
jgi:hypothetical protein